MLETRSRSFSQCYPPVKQSPMINGRRPIPASSTLPRRFTARSALVLLIALAGCSVAGEAEKNCATALVYHPVFKENLCPKVGRFGNTKLAVPQHYLLGPFVYKGVDIWNKESWEKRPKTPTFDNEIGNFAIKIRHTNFQPILSRQDWEDYGKLGSAIRAQPPENRWIHVGFETPANRHGTPTIPYFYQMESTLGLQIYGQLVLQREKAWGLDHYLGKTPPGRGLNQVQHEFFFDSSTRKTKIHCKTWFRSAVPHDLLTSCTHSFLTTDGEALVDISNIQDRSDIARWREVEQGLQEVYRSFMVAPR